MMKKFVYWFLALSPVFALAQTTNLSGLAQLVDSFKAVLDRVIPVLFGLAIIYFFWGLIKYIRSAGDPKAAAEGRSIMIWGVVALFVMISVYGLINFLAGTLGLNNTQVSLPKLPSQ